MARQVETKSYFTFVGGLNTEGSYLTSVPNTWREGYNLTPQINGELWRRNGVDLEEQYSLSAVVNATVKTSLAHSIGKWDSVAGKGSRNFVVTQTGPMIYFYDNVGSTVSTTRKSFSIDLTPYLVSGNPNSVGSAPISCTSGNGKLVIVSQDTKPILVTYNETTNSITVEEITIQIRDFEGVNDGLAIDNRPATLSNLHNYNLLNQGWTATNITAYFAIDALYPSNAQVWTEGKNSSDVFTPALLDLQDFGTSPAPKGRFILDLFNRNRTSVSGVAGLTTYTELYRPTTSAFFGGRIWYAGIKSNAISSWILFSQVANDSSKYGKCYQDADPTSEIISDLVASDGGYISIQDIGTIVKLIPLGASMLILADNGVWQVTGADTGFSADTYSVNKVTSIGCVSATSVVAVESTVAYWGAGGIYVFNIETNAANITAGTFSVSALTDQSIKTFYNDIPTQSKAFASAAYSEENKIIYWAFNDNHFVYPIDGVTNRFNKNKILCFDTRLKAFYYYDIANDLQNPAILDLFISKTRGDTLALTNVLTSAGGVDSVISNSSDVISTIVTGSTNTTTLKFLTVVEGSSTEFRYTFSDFNNFREDGSEWADWKSSDGIGAEVVPYFITGFEASNNEIESTYLIAYMRRTETGTDELGNPIKPSSVKVQSMWDWTDSSTAGRWSTQQQAYRHRRVLVLPPSSTSYDDSYAVVSTKLKVRGYGRAVQFNWSGEVGKDFKLVGWGVVYLAEPSV